MHSYPLYYEQPYQKTHTATIVDIIDGNLILDATICYPEGGGQSGDIGTISGVQLLNTTKDDDHTIHHHVKQQVFHIGQQVNIELDWQHRFHFMQMHTAQHVASGLLFTRFGIQTVSVHQGERILTIETDAASVDQEICFELEDLVNAVIRGNHPVHYEVHTRTSAQSLGLRRSIKVEGDGVRLVVVEDVDTVACGGLHVANTTEIELFHYSGQEKIRGHIRLIFTVGQMARQQIRKAQDAVTELGVLFSAPLEDLVEVAKASVAQAAQTKSELRRAQQAIASLQLSSLVAHAPLVASIPVVYWNVPQDIDMKDVAQAFPEHEDLLLFAAKMVDGRLLWLVGVQGKASTLFDFNTRKSTLLSAIEGKGGGKAPLFQGSAKAVSAVFFSTCKDLMQ